MFTGEFRHSVDEKGRVAMPARFRSQLEDGVVVTRWLDACLAVFPKAGFETLAERVAATSVTDPTARMFSRYLFAKAMEAELDRQNRILLPAATREWLGLGTEAMVVGARDHAEIWVPDRWTEYQREMESPDALASHLAGLVI